MQGLSRPGTAMDRYIDKPYVARIIDEHAGGINHRLLIWSFIASRNGAGSSKCEKACDEPYDKACHKVCEKAERCG